VDCGDSTATAPCPRAAAVRLWLWIIPKSDMPSLPPDLQVFADALTSADRTADAIAGRVNDDEFFWQPDGGRRWSIALCLNHLTLANTIYAGAMRGAIQKARAAGWTRTGPAAAGFFGRKFAASLEPPVKRRTRAPGKIKPMPATSRAEVLRAYHAAHDEVRQLIADAAAIDVNRATFQNPFIGLVRVKVSTGFHVIAAHDRRHLWQAEQVEAELRKGSADPRDLRT
jgi:hypothetical protein